MKKLDYKLHQSNISRNLHQISFQIMLVMIILLQKVKVPTKQFSCQQQITSSRYMSTAIYNKIKLDFFCIINKQMNISELVNIQVKNTLFLFKTKVIINYQYEQIEFNQIREKKQQNIKQNDLKDIKDQSVQCDITKTTKLFFERNIKQKESISKNNYQQQLTTINTFNFNLIRTTGIDNLNSRIQSTMNSTIPSSYNELSIHQIYFFPSPQFSIHA
ncbi:unnamed protein product [Paramecium sonneborni]|uniref:Uncharacterized protein n=1 Tax=Paramecium sonneborni TaxID=65129 RepID=A0A8S1RRI4_9CILI|nr:unnamed protein product [Paramecium sonneborni]